MGQLLSTEKQTGHLFVYTRATMLLKRGERELKLLREKGQRILCREDLTMDQKDILLWDVRRAIYKYKLGVRQLRSIKQSLKDPTYKHRKIDKVIVIHPIFCAQT